MNRMDAPTGAVEQSRGRAASGRPRTRRRDGEHSALGERLIAGVPARIMRPRIVFLACLAAILGFGLLMVYSASSVEALKETGSSVYYLQRQAIFIAVGLICMIAVSRVPLAAMRTDVVWWVWLGMLFLLFLVLAIGRDAGGARRWIVIAGQQFQPSEFAKSIIVVTAAKIFYEYYEIESINTQTFLIMLGACVFAPLLAIILEPDMGTCLIIGATVFCMAYFAGFSYKLIGCIVAVGVVAVLVLILSSSYRADRLFLGDPWEDPYDTGYQATLAIMAFASGGLFGRGVGNSTMKYNYLPEAHNDYILAIIGEELGLVGTLAFFAVFAVMVYAAFKIAWQSPSIQGRLIASGSIVLISMQFLINVLGILGVTPMTGKTLPFISYGGSSMIASLILMGLILRVSIESNPKTVYDVRRDDFAVVDESTAGEAHPRSSRSGGFTVLDGASGRPDARTRRDADADGGRREGRRPSSGRNTPLASMRSDARGAASSSARSRIDLGNDPADRLRSSGPRVGYDRGGYAPGGSRTTRSPRGRRYDR